MAGKKLEYQIGVDSSDAQRGVKDFSRTVQSELKKVEGDFDDTATAGERVATVLSAMARDLDAELDRAAQAADALATALGPELAGKADVGAIVGDLQRMGLTFEDITTDADKLAASLKEMDQVQLKGLNSGLGGVNTKLGQLHDKSDQTRSVMANLAGNAAQDLGAISGVAGTAGVALGQLAEQASEGNISLGGLAKLGGPMIALAGAVEAVSTIVEGMAFEREFDAKNVEQFTKALREAKTVAQSVKEEVLETGRLDTVVSGKGFLGLGKGAKDILPQIEQVLGGLNEYNELVKDPAAIKALRARATAVIIPKPSGVEQATQAELDRAEAMFLVADAAEQQAKDTAAAEDAQREFARINTITTKEMEAAAAAWKAAEDPISRFPASYQAIARALADGVTPPAKEVELIMEATGLSIDEILTNAQGINDQLAEAKAKTDDWKRSVDEVKVSTAEAMDNFDAERIDAVTTALGDFLSARQPGITWLDTIADTKEAFRDVWKDIKGNEDTIPDIFAVSTEKGRDFRDAIDEASQAVNQQLLQALENAGGDFQAVLDQADALRERMIKKVEMRTGLSMDVPAERTKILGLVNAIIPPDKKLQVGIELAKKDLTQLKADLAIEQLQALLPATALQLKVDMAEGDISPREAAATAQEILTENGVAVDLEVNTRKANDDLILFAREERNTAMSVEITGLPEAAAAIDGGPGGRGWPPIEVPVKPVIVPGGYSYLTGGGAGTLAAPTGRGVTPVAATGTGTMAPIPIPVTAAATKVEQHFHQTFNAGVFGDTWDVMMAVEQANKKAARLLPKNP